MDDFWNHENVLKKCPYVLPYSQGKTVRTKYLFAHAKVLTHPGTAPPTVPTCKPTIYTIKLPCTKSLLCGNTSSASTGRRERPRPHLTLDHGAAHSGGSRFRSRGGGVRDSISGKGRGRPRCDAQSAKIPRERWEDFKSSNARANKALGMAKWRSQTYRG